MRVVDSVLELIGETPLVRLARLPHAEGAEVWAKAEHLNPTGSVKDRTAHALVEAGEKSGALRPAGLIVEATSGSTGAALALVAGMKRHPIVLVMPKSMSLERRSLLRALGAELVLTDPELGMEGAVHEATRIADARGGWMPRHLDEALCAEVHARTTAVEIADALGGVPDVLVSAVGSGATITGVGRALRARGPVRLVAVEPASSPVLSGGARGPTKIQGIGFGRVPGGYDASTVDEVRTVDDRAAWAIKGRLAREEGLLVGVSAGANVAVACDIAKRLARSARVVTFLCDTGERYFSLASFFAEPAA